MFERLKEVAASTFGWGVTAEQRQLNDLQGKFESLARKAVGREYSNIFYQLSQALKVKETPERDGVFLSDGLTSLYTDGAVRPTKKAEFTNAISHARQHLAVCNQAQDSMREMIKNMRHMPDLPAASALADRLEAKYFRASGGKELKVQGFNSFEGQYDRREWRAATIHQALVHANEQIEAVEAGADTYFQLGSIIDIQAKAHIAPLRFPTRAA